MNTRDPGREITVACPKCQTVIPITSALSAQVEGEIRREYDQKVSAKQEELKKKNPENKGQQATPAPKDTLKKK